MEAKNTILSNYGMALVNMSGAFNGAVLTLGEDTDENTAIIKTLNVLLESVRSETVLIQAALDSYGV